MDGVGRLGFRSWEETGLPSEPQKHHNFSNEVLLRMIYSSIDPWSLSRHDESPGISPDPLHTH